MAGTTGAVMYLRPTTTAYVQVNFKTAAVLYIVLRTASGIFGSGASVSTQNTDTTLKAWLPSQRTQVLNTDGSMNPMWYRFFDFLVNQKLGGADAPSVTDLANTASTTQAAVTSQVATVAAIDAKSTQNAQALSVAVEVIKFAALFGAGMIPAVDTAPVEESRGGE